MIQLSEHFKAAKIEEIKDFIGIGGHFTKIETEDAHSLREWWYTIIRNYGNYPCYAIFLVLSSDKEVVQYLQETRMELNAISGSSCLIIVLGNNLFITSGLKNPNLIPNDFMVTAIGNHITNCESAQVAELFGIDLTLLPCIVFFSDIRSSEYAFISLKNLDSSKINKTLREIFTVIHRQVKEKPTQIIEAIRKYSALDKISNKGQQALRVVVAFFGKTIEMVVDAWVKSVIR